MHKFLMCRPDYFDVAYEINPWMVGNIHQASAAKAHEQWQDLYDLLNNFAEVELVAPQKGLPDMPFTANAGLIYQNKAIVSRFLHAERQGEEEHFEKWFAENNFEVLNFPKDTAFEGAGDALIDRGERRIWMGYGHRTALNAERILDEFLDVEILPLRLADKRFYHLDTCFCPLSEGFLLYYPPAFFEESQKLISEKISNEKLITISEEDAINFACNAVNADEKIILNKATEKLAETLNSKGFEVFQTPLSEFMKAGGSAKCLTLRIDEP